MSESIPVYLDGVLIPAEIVEVTPDDAPDFPQKKLKAGTMKIWYRLMTMYDRTRLTFEQMDKEVQMKVRIPYWPGIAAGDVVLVDDEQLSVYNAAVAWTKSGIRETELTLIKPQTLYEVIT